MRAKEIIQQVNLEADDYDELEKLCVQRLRIERIERYRTVYSFE